MATRNKDFASLYRKVVTMKKRVAVKKERGVDESSVGTIDAIDEDDDELQQKVG
jgi:hypothetical protein